MRWASAASDDPLLDRAIASVARSVQDALEGEPADLAVVFVSQHYATRYGDVSELLNDALPYGVLLGCSAGGVIGGGREVEQRPGVSLTAAVLPGVAINSFVVESARVPDQDASPRAWHEVTGVPAEPTPQFILLADPFSFPADEFLTGLDYAYPQSVKVGGLASGARVAGGNALYAGESTRRSGLAGVALSGNIRIDTIVAQGCRPIGKPLPITRCEGNVLLEVGGRPPLQAIRDLVSEMSDRDRRLMSHSLFLGIEMDELERGEPRAGDFLIRNLVGLDPERGALAIGENLRNGQTVQFHLRDAQTSAEDLSLLLERYTLEKGGKGGAAPSGALLFSCLGRGIHLYGAADHDTGLFRERLGDVPIGGFFCNGEIGPVGGSTHLHGYTSSFGIFGPAR